MQYNISKNVGKVEQHLLRHLLYAGDFPVCTNSLVKLTLGDQRLILQLVKDL
jgi:hypothetical protein